MTSIESIDEKISRLDKRKSELLKQKRKIENESEIKDFEIDIAGQNSNLTKILENAGYSQYIIPQFQIDKYHKSRGRLSVSETATVSLRSKPEDKVILTKIVSVNDDFKWSNKIVSNIELIMQIMITFKSLIDESFYSSDTIRLKKNDLKIDVKFAEQGLSDLYAFGDIIESSDQGMKFSLDEYSTIRITPCEAEAYFEYERRNVDGSILLDEILEIIRQYEKSKDSVKLT